MMMIIVS